MPLTWPHLYLILIFVFLTVLQVFIVPEDIYKICTCPNCKIDMQVILDGICEYCLYTCAVSIPIFKNELETTKNDKF